MLELSTTILLLLAIMAVLLLSYHWQLWQHYQQLAWVLRLGSRWSSSSAGEPANPNATGKTIACGCGMAKSVVTVYYYYVAVASDARTATSNASGTGTAAQAVNAVQLGPTAVSVARGATTVNGSSSSTEHQA